MIVEPAQQLYGHELALCPLVLAQIFIAAQLHAPEQFLSGNDRLSDHKTFLSWVRTPTIFANYGSDPS